MTLYAHTAFRGAMTILACLLAPLCTALHAQPGFVRTEAAHPYRWHTAYLDVYGLDTAGVIDHGSLRAGRVERCMLLVNHSIDTVWFDVRGCCSNDYYWIDKAALAPGDTAHLTIGFDIHYVRGAMQKATSLVVMGSPGRATWERAYEHLVFRTRVNRLLDLRILPTEYIVMDQVGSAVTTAHLDVIATRDSAIDVRAEVVPSRAATIRCSDTATHHLLDGDTLRLTVEVSSNSPDTRSSDYIGAIRLVTSSAELRAITIPIIIPAQGKP